PLLPAFLPELSGRPLVPSPQTGERREETAPSGPAPDLEAFIRQRLGPDASDLYAETHRQVDRLLLPLVLEHTGGNQHQAARLLGIARQTLRQKLREGGFHFTRRLEAEEDDQP